LRFPGSVRLVIIGGEKALPECLAMWQQRVGRGLRLVNTYGPTETTIVATTCDLDHEASEGEVPIGSPVANAEAYVLDDRGHPVPIGVAGELCVGGKGVTRGYLNRPDVTAERFVPNAFSAVPGARFYRTGDRVRYLNDGRLQYLGRFDDQVKIRGFRIEPGEIEAVLRRSPDVRDAIVRVIEDEGEARLVAYVVPEQDATPATLKGFLTERLPHYMIPAAFVALAEFPLTPSGKIDRQRLPQPESFRSDAENTYQAPETALEKVLCGLWEEVLRVEQVGVGDNFFGLGGHSLLSTRLLARVGNAFDMRLPLRVLFESPTVRGMAKALLNASGTDVETKAKVLIELSELSDEEAVALLDLQLTA